MPPISHRTTRHRISTPTDRVDRSHATWARRKTDPSGLDQCTSVVQSGVWPTHILAQGRGSIQTLSSSDDGTVEEFYAAVASNSLPLPHLAHVLTHTLQMS